MAVVMIENSERGIAWKLNDDDEMNLLSGQVNAFLRLLHAGKSAESTASNFQEYEFVQHINVFGSTDVPIDVVEETLGCIWIAWSRGDSDGEVIPGKYFGSCRLDLLSGTVRGVEVFKSHTD